MKVERWEEESDEDWAERLAEEITLANNTETTKYFIEKDPDPYDHDRIIINYIGEAGWTWKEHPEGPFSCKQVLEWKNKAEKLPIYEKQFRHMTEHALELEDKLEAVKKIVDEWGEQRSDPHGLEYDWHYKDKYFALRDALESSGFTTKDEDEK